ncbi:MAG: hypothetical protein V7L05_34450 [Nostoc sp.]|uniref:hypothetical protein n=1 Tax=Nostoc sp. TaxID=1180 RepID=UPI002FF95A27
MASQLLFTLNLVVNLLLLSSLSSNSRKNRRTGSHNQDLRNWHKQWRGSDFRAGFTGKRSLSMAGN